MVRRDESWFWNSETSMRQKGVMIGKLGEKEKRE
jgi:hypothetical protein